MDTKADAFQMPRTAAARPIPQQAVLGTPAMGFVGRAAGLAASGQRRRVPRPPQQPPQLDRRQQVLAW